MAIPVCASNRLKELKRNPPYTRLDRMGAVLETGLRDAAAAAGVPVQLNRVGSMWTLFFTGTPVTDYDPARVCDTKRFARFFWAMSTRAKTRYSSSRV